jgi:hypothetical protein
MASIIAESRGGIPRWYFQTVIDRYYDLGLRFFVLVYDHGAAAYGRAVGHLFYSVAGDFSCDTAPLDARSEHCIALTVPDYVTSDDPAEPPDEGTAKDVYVPSPEPSRSSNEEYFDALLRPREDATDDRAALKVGLALARDRSSPQAIDVPYQRARKFRAIAEVRTKTRKKTK